MKYYTTEKIRNIGIVGHGGEGKTTLTEAMLFCAGHTDRMGKVDDGTATTDFDAEENKRHISISASSAPIEWKEHKINVIDSPGYFDFEGEVIETMSVADGVLIVVGAVSGCTVGAEKAWNLCKKSNLPKAFVVNRMDTENANFEKTVNALIAKFGTSVIPVQFPIMNGMNFTGYVDAIGNKAYKFDGKKASEIPVPANIESTLENYRSQIVEAAAENDEDLMEKYLEGQDLTADEIAKGLNIGISTGSIAPVFCTAAAPQIGVNVLMDSIISYMPAPNAVGEKEGINPKDNSKSSRKCDPKAPFSAQVFKTVADKFVGKISLFKIYSGTLSSDMSIVNANAEKPEKQGNVLMVRGEKTTIVNKLCAGDIGAVAKLQSTATGDTLCDANQQIIYPAIIFPNTAFSMAVAAKKSGEEDKVFGGLNKLCEEDPTFKLEKNSETGDMLMKGLGEMHLDVVCAKLRNKFSVEAQLSEPTIPYRETIRKPSKAQGRHKKQSGGHGQFGDVWVEFTPITKGTEEFEFVDKIVGGVVPRNYIPAVEKGLKEAMKRGVLAGYPMINVRCTLVDGSYHAVDSNEMAFRTAARLAYKKGCLEASPVLMEPIYRYEVVVPDEYMGDIIGDMNRRRGRIMGMNPTGEGLQQVVAEVPYAEMFKYATDLRSMTQGRGKYDASFERYEDVPANIAQKVIDKAKKDEVAEED